MDPVEPYDSVQGEEIGLQNNYETNDPARDLFKSFLGKMRNLSQLQKLNLLYSYIVGKKSNPGIDSDKKLIRMLYELKYGKLVKETEAKITDKKQFKVPFKWKSAFRKSAKARELLLVFYLNVKGDIESPKLYPLYSGNIVIIRNKPYEVNPRAFWRFGKNKCLIIREIDRRPVSNLDYDEVKARGDSTDSDEILIKTVLKASTMPQKKEMANKGLIIAAIVIVVIVGVVFWLMKGG